MSAMEDSRANGYRVAERIEAFVRERFSVSAGDPRFGRAVDLFGGGYVDSIGFVELLAFLEDEFGVDVPEDELLSDQFTCIDGMACVVARLATT